jgi:hypothetical protein
VNSCYTATDGRDVDLFEDQQARAMREFLRFGERERESGSDAGGEPRVHRGEVQGAARTPFV